MTIIELFRQLYISTAFGMSALNQSESDFLDYIKSIKRNNPRTIEMKEVNGKWQIESKKKKSKGLLSSIFNFKNK